MNLHRKAMQEAHRHWREAYGLAWTLVKDRGRAEELCQEALLRLGTMKRTPDLDQPIRTLLLSIVRNLALSDRRRPRPESLDDSDHGNDLAASATAGPAARLLHKERSEQVREALDRLAPTWCAMLYLRDGLGLAYADIARVLDKSEGVVRVTLHRARKRLRELLHPSLLREDVS